MSHSEQSKDHRSSQRFAVNVAVRVKTSHSDEEVACSSRDVSRSGIFLVTDQTLPENSPIEFTMKLRTPGAPEAGVQVLCSGTVVRVVAPSDDSVGMAVTIDSYRFLHAKANA